MRFHHQIVQLQLPCSPALGKNTSICQLCHPLLDDYDVSSQTSKQGPI